MTIQNMSGLAWHAKQTLPPGAVSALAYGDPAKGHYCFYAKFPANYTVPAHWHSFTCMVVLIKGSMTIKREGMPDVSIAEGGFFTLPGKMKYVAYTPDECVFIAYGENPFDIIYVNPGDDPRNHQ